MEFIILLLAVLGTFSSAFGSAESAESDTAGTIEDGLLVDEAFCVSWNQDSTFNPEINKCVIPVGRRCRKDKSEIETCPPNSYCDDDSVLCLCERLFRVGENPEFKVGETPLACLRAKSHDESCTIPQECDEKTRLSCQNGKCLCTNADLSWSNESSNCIYEDCDDRFGFINYGLYNQGHAEGFTDRGTNRCTLTLQDWSINIELMKDQLIYCPANAHVVSLSGGPIFRGSLVHCECDTPFTPNRKGSACFIPKKFGDECVYSDRQYSDDECDKVSKLSCQMDNVCGCDADEIWYQSSPNSSFKCATCQDRFPTSYFDSTTKTCAFKINSLCSPEPVKSGPTCPLNSECRISEESDELGSEYRCKCDGGYLPNPHQGYRTCFKKLEFGDRCEIEDDPCSNGQELYCLPSKTCGCSPGQIWDKAQNRCATKFGQICGRNDCATHSYCTYSYNGRCSCEAGYSVSEDGRCFGDHVAICESSSDCWVGLKCLDGLCKCERSNEQVYDPKLKRCLNKVGSPCSNTTAGIGTNCVPNSTCSNGICTCEIGSKQTTLGGCSPVKGFGDSCSSGQCDYSKGLACTEGICSCFDPSLKYQNGTKICTASLGRNCGWVDPSGTCEVVNGSKRCDLYQVSCEEGMHCKGIGMGAYICVQ